MNTTGDGCRKFAFWLLHTDMHRAHESLNVRLNGLTIVRYACADYAESVQYRG